MSDDDGADWQQQQDNLAQLWHDIEAEIRFFEAVIQRLTQHVNQLKETLK